MAADNRFALDTGGRALGLTDTTVLFDSGQAEDIRFILAVLNSRPMTLRYTFIGKLKGSVREYFWNGIGELRIPRLDLSDVEQRSVHDVLVRLVEHRAVSRDDEALGAEAKIDAVLAHQVWRLTRDEVELILDSLPVVREADLREHGSYRTKLMVLDSYDRIEGAVSSGQPFQAGLKPSHPVGPGVTFPAVPALPPTVDPQVEPMFVCWALLRQAGDRIARAHVARAFALRSDPDLLVRLAPANFEDSAQQWAQRVGTRAVLRGTLARTIRALVERDGIRQITDSGGSVLLEATSHTPDAARLDDWYIFEAQLALAVLDALPAESLGAVDGSMSGEDRQLLAGGA